MACTIYCHSCGRLVRLIERMDESIARSLCITFHMHSVHIHSYIHEMDFYKRYMQTSLKCLDKRTASYKMNRIRLRTLSHLITGFGLIMLSAS